MISDIPFNSKGNLKDHFKESQQRAASSKTYISDDLIIQKREGRLFQMWDSRIQLLSSIDDPKGLLQTIHCTYELDPSEKHLWIKHERLDLPGSPSVVDYKSASPEKLIHVLRETLPTILETETLLRNSSLDPSLIIPLFQEEVAKAHNVRMVSHEIISEICARLGYQSNIPLPQTGPIVLSHGDVLGKNIILTTDGYRMIDWDTVGFYPSEMTLSHALVWNLRRIPEVHWRGFLDDILKDCLFVMDLSWDEARLALYWYMLREIIYWSKDQPLDSSLLIKAERLLD